MYKTFTCLGIFVSSLVFAQAYQPAHTRLITTWGQAVNPQNVWQQYPRPQLERKEWKNLNGLWNYSIKNKGSVQPTSYDGKILVPFGIESALSGVGKPLLPDQELWYNRSFTIPDNWKGKDILLHFDAVDWEARVWVNDKLVGSHKGGSDPFSFNITPYLKPSGQQKLVVAVWDPTDTDFQARGKQVLDHKGIWYTAVSGIWQSVWLEPVSKSHISNLYPVPDIDKGTVKFHIKGENLNPSHQLHFVIKSNGRVIKDTTVAYASALELPISQAQLWTPETPHLYQTSVTVKQANKVLDAFKTYFAMRKVSMVRDANGYLRLALNNKPVFHFGTLDQGWWPDGLLTPPSEEAMMFDIIKLKEMGFNTIRKHIKVEPSRYYYQADSIGVLLWQDMPSGFKWPDHPSHVKHEDKEDWARPKESAIQFEKEWKAIMDHLRFFPSIVMWVPFNEGWGQYDTKRITEWTKQYDPTRIVNSPSGWTDRGVGDVLDVHQYPGPGMGIVEQNKNRAMVLGEFGGLGLVIKGHIWDPNKRNWGYKTYTQDSVLVREYTELMHNLALMVKRGLAAAIYTQTTDVEGEVNGLMTYDRKVIKIEENLLRRLHAPMYDQPDDGVITFINQRSETDRPLLLYSYNATSTDWLTTSSTNFQQSKQPVELKKDGNVFAYQNVDLKKVPEGLGLKLYASGNVTVYINGVLVWSEDEVRIKRHYDDINLSQFTHLLKPGHNRIAVVANKATQKVPFDFSLYQWNRKS